MDTLQIIKDILQDNLEIDSETVTLDSTLESLAIDSLDLVELICDLEARCDIQLGYPENLNSVGDIVEYIESL